MKLYRDVAVGIGIHAAVVYPMFDEKALLFFPWLRYKYNIEKVVLPQYINNISYN